MRIERNPLTSPAVDVEKSSKPTAPVSSPTVSAFEDSHRLNQALAGTPEVRADQVARAKALVADPNYPSKEQLDKVAGLLAASLQREG